jgi:hypothetical protein
MDINEPQDEPAATQVAISWLRWFARTSRNDAAVFDAKPAILDSTVGRDH